MKTSLVALVLGFVLALVLTPLVRAWARRRLVDSPEDGRKVHNRPIPRTGGLAIAAGVLGPILGLALHENQISALIYQDGARIVTLLLGAVAALALGLLDDLFRVPAKFRLLAIFGIALFEWLGGHRIDAVTVPSIGTVQLGLFSLPVTLLWIAGIIVAFNFIDGLDGLAGGIALIGTLTMLMMAYIDGNLLWLTWAGAMAGALLGFLCFNFNPASIFMGDSGSNFLGFLMALVSLETSRKGPTAVALFVPMLAAGLPILDAALTMVRRALMREGLFVSERGHIHHRLLDIGLTHRRAVLVLYAFTVVLSLSALALLSKIPTLQLTAAVVIAAAIFWLMFVTGYVRLEDLRLMYRQGVRNKARARILQDLVEDAVSDIAAAPIWDLEASLSRLIGRTGISGVSWSRTDGSRLVVGDFEDKAKGVRASFSFPDGDQTTEIVFLWRGRASGPSQSEVVALRTFLARAAERTPGATTGLDAFPLKPN